MISTDSALFIKKKICFSPEQHLLKSRLRSKGLFTVCEEARCPNLSECFQNRTATFLALGEFCTRDCLFCSVQTGHPLPPDSQEGEKICELIDELELDYVVITSVTRDDLPDGGACHLAGLAETVKKRTSARVELLFPDLKGKNSSLEILARAPIDVYNHNIEMVSSLFPALRPQGNYRLSLEVLNWFSAQGKYVKSGFMVGLGETMEDIGVLISDLRSAGVCLLTVGQYLQPDKTRARVVHYYSEQEFKDIKKIAEQVGIKHVFAGSFVRSSYKASALYKKIYQADGVRNRDRSSMERRMG